MKIKPLCTPLFAVTATCASAATKPTLAVEGVQMPAWVERAGGERDALTVGASIGNDAKVSK
jgi:hypothetical protein